MAKYLDSTGVSTLWEKVKERDEALNQSKAGYINISGNTIQLLDKQNGTVLSSIDASAFVKDGMLDDVEIVAANQIAGGILYDDGIRYGLDDATAHVKFLHFNWKLNDGDKTKQDFIKLEDLAPAYKGDDECIEIKNDNTITFKEAAATKINVKGMTIGGTHFGDQLKAQLDGKNTIDDMSVQEILELLLSKETFTKVTVSGPEIKTSMTAPTVTLYTDAACTKKASGSVEPGTVLYVKASCGSASGSLNTSWSGFTNGHTTALNGAVISGNPQAKSETMTKISSDNYVMSFSMSNLKYTATDFSTLSKSTYSDCAITGKAVTCDCAASVNSATATVTANTTGPNFNVTLSENYPKYYNISTLGKTYNKENPAPEEGVHYISAIGKGTYTSETKPTSTNSASVSIKRKMFYGYAPYTDEFDASTYFSSSVIRQGTSASFDTTSELKISVKSGETARVFWVAVPTAKSLSNACNKKGYDVGNRKNEFKQLSSNISVDAATSAYAANYKVYYFDANSVVNPADDDGEIRFKIQ